ncbi:hypothetical protein BH10ACI1_BH10ACI1_03770 [soil metagenome]
MNELRKTESISQKWRRRRLAVACLLIAFCFLLGGDVYRAKAIVFDNKELFRDKKKVVNYQDLTRKRIFETDLRQKFWVNPNRKVQKPLLKALLVGADQCGAGIATPILALPYNDTGTTVGLTDNYDLPPDVTAPTLTGCPTCNGIGAPSGRGFVYTGTGTGPDAAYVISFGATADMVVNMDPTSTQDLALIVYTNVCSSNLADGIVVDDTGGGGVLESVSITNMPAGTYNIVVDGYSTGGTPPGLSGSYTLNVTGTVQPINPVAAGVSIGGRIVRADGNAISGVRVSITKPSGEILTVRTSSFGYYKFEDLEVGLTYTIQVADKRYQFANPTQVISLQDAIEDLDFTATP